MTQLAVAYPDGPVPIFLHRGLQDMGRRFAPTGVNSLKERAQFGGKRTLE
jgi:hypothetical protein